MPTSGYLYLEDNNWKCSQIENCFNVYRHVEQRKRNIKSITAEQQHAVEIVDILQIPSFCDIKKKKKRELSESFQNFSHILRLPRIGITE